MKRFFFAAALIASVAFGSSQSADAGLFRLFSGSHGSYGSTGSYGGSSYGSYGSGGSYGSYRTVSYGSGGSYGSHGSSSGYTRRQSRVIYRTARSSSYGSYGSNGASYGSYGRARSYRSASYGSHGYRSSSYSYGTSYSSSSYGSYSSYGGYSTYRTSSSYGSRYAPSYSSYGTSYAPTYSYAPSYSSYGTSYAPTYSYGYTTYGHMSSVTSPAVNSDTQYISNLPGPVPAVSSAYIASAPAVKKTPLAVSSEHFAAQSPAVLTSLRGPGLAVVEEAPVERVVADDNFAYVVVQLPEDATLYLGGNKTSVSGGIRKFKIPVSDSSKRYSYKIRAELTRQGQTYVAESTETLVAGKTVSIKVNDVAVTLAAR